MSKTIECETHDVDDQAGTLMGYRQFYEQLGRGRFRGAMWQLVMADGALFRESTNRQLRQQVTPPQDHIALAMPLAVESGSMFAGLPLERESLMVLTGAEEYDILLAGQTELIGLNVHRNMLKMLAPAKVEWLQRAERERNLPSQTLKACGYSGFGAGV